jgi:hypothetical protein
MVKLPIFGSCKEFDVLEVFCNDPNKPPHDLAICTLVPWHIYIFYRTNFLLQLYRLQVEENENEAKLSFPFK